MLFSILTTTARNKGSRGQFCPLQCSIVTITPHATATPNPFGYVHLGEKMNAVHVSGYTVASRVIAVVFLREGVLAGLC